MQRPECDSAAAGWRLGADSPAFERRLQHRIGALCAPPGRGVTAGRCLPTWSGLLISRPKPGRFFSEDGKTTALKPGRVFEQAGENRLEEGFLASPAIAGKAFYLRTRTHLYRIEEK